MQARGGGPSGLPSVRASSQAQGASEGPPAQLRKPRQFGAPQVQGRRSSSSARNLQRQHRGRVGGWVGGGWGGSRGLPGSKLPQALMHRPLSAACLPARPPTRLHSHLPTLTQFPNTPPATDGLPSCAHPTRVHPPVVVSELLAGGDGPAGDKHQPRPASHTQDFGVEGGGARVVLRMHAGGRVGAAPGVCLASAGVVLKEWLCGRVGGRAGAGTVAGPSQGFRWAGGHGQGV